LREIINKKLKQLKYKFFSNIIDMEQEPKLVTKTYEKKNGDKVVKQYNQNLYNKTFQEKNKKEILEKHTCECGGKYTMMNKYHHISSKKHNRWINKVIKE